jgi:hypothetical protein
MNNFAMIEIHRNGRPSGRVWSVVDDPRLSDHKENWILRMKNAECVGGPFDSDDEAVAFAESLLTVDERGYTQWRTE